MRVFIAKHRTCLLIKSGGVIIRAIIPTIVINVVVIAVLIVVAVGNERRLQPRCINVMKIDQRLLMIMVLLMVVIPKGGVVMVFWSVWIWPQLSFPSCLPYRSQHLLLLCPPHHCYLLHINVNIHIIHS